MDSVIGWIILCVGCIIGIVYLVRKGLKEINNNSGDDGITRHRVRRR